MCQSSGHMRMTCLLSWGDVVTYAGNPRTRSVANVSPFVGDGIKAQKFGGECVKNATELMSFRCHLQCRDKSLNV
jgi:hypothetical protein